MSNLNEDILYLIFEELKDDGNAPFSCLLVNKNWFNIIIPILWKNPWKNLKKKTILLKVIISHLSEESKNNLKSQNVLVSTTSYQKPLFDYISFCKHLNFEAIFDIANSHDKIINEIIKLFINENRKFTHLYIPNQFNHKIHLIPGFEYCFSRLELLQCDIDNNNQNILEELAKICKSIRNLEFISTTNTEISGIIKLITVQKELSNVCYYSTCQGDNVEESLIKHMNTIQYLKINEEPSGKFLSYFINLISLEIGGSIYSSCWKHLENASLPHLKFLIAKNIPSEYLAKLIETTKGKLCEISIISLRYDDHNKQKLLQAIAQNCPSLKYLMLILENRDFVEFEKLLINCQYLDGLIIILKKKYDLEFNCNKLFEILTNSSPIGLFKFKFVFFQHFQLESLNLFFDKWKGRNPMLLHTVPMYSNMNLEKYFVLVEKYKAEGIVKQYENDLCGDSYEEFEWIKKRI
ncbi:hypothetical protein RclHR1_06320004 [Rhizophagus clarus]|uniref:F-box domain-containing protein n=1 Tax=Rhizophagus clarus TaxID=94130 RepID=A0A2Z6RRS4_9GLOM|nr:hypothetical protein RclHR1_06320004 [Rhizophagus clarus]GES93953.1 hypothetical protein GLOIN_2v1878750 [Rhizophagus clarus]